MSEFSVSVLNRDILYPEGKIYWEEGKNWTSDLFKKLYSLGWRTSSQKGIVTLYNAEGDLVISSLLGRCNMLYELAILMR